jgi:heterodisulfide reductase subunit A-like polyferredoxin
MRVISQNGMLDIPYEEFVFGITKDNKIACCRECVATPSEIYNGIIAAYSSKEKALKAMEMLREQHEKVAFLKTIINTEKGTSFVRCLSETDFDKMTRNYFQFPKDNEVEV